MFEGPFELDRMSYTKPSQTDLGTVVNIGGEGNPMRQLVDISDLEEISRAAGQVAEGEALLTVPRSVRMLQQMAAMDYKRGSKQKGSLGDGRESK